MVDSRIEKLAKLCVHYSTEVKPKEKVLIWGSNFSLPLIREIYKECLLYDAYPHIRTRLDVEFTFFKYAKEHQLQYQSPYDKFIVENTDVLLEIFCDPNPKRLSNIDPAKIQIHRASQRDIMDIVFKRRSEGKFRVNGLVYPIYAQAQEASMSLTEYEEFVYRSCFVDHADPIAEWTNLHQKQEKICEFLNHIRELHIIGEDTDLTLTVEGRKWINCSGKLNMPDGEVFTSPIENSVNGTIRFTYPGTIRGKKLKISHLCLGRARLFKLQLLKVLT